MTDIAVKSAGGMLVSAVEADSAANRAGITPGDLITEINGRPILDILDYRFHASESKLRIVTERDGVRRQVTLRKDEEEDAGLTFSQDLSDKIHTCKNKCVFCFIHQMPRKMRKSLYLMDDDFRLSFMHGNYVTLTNLSDAEWARILEQRLSPLYVSVHATVPELRRMLLGRREPSPILPQLRELAANRIDVHAQIVLCPGLNDGDALLNTLEELAREHPSSTNQRAGVQSVAIVPVGLTRFRERLPQLTHVERDYASEMIDNVTMLEKQFRLRLGTRFAWLADEWYYLAERPVPAASHYEEFPQLEDGIGTMRLFLDDAKAVLRRLPERCAPVQATLVTAEMPSTLVKEFALGLERAIGVELNVCVVKNDFFGGDVRIAGLLTGTDIVKSISAMPDCHPLVVIPRICLREDGVFLDDITVPELSDRIGRAVAVSGNRPSDLAHLLNIVPSRKPAVHSGWLMEPQN